MDVEVISLNVSPRKLVAELRGLVPAPESISELVGEIIEAVRARGDEAVSDFTKRFDTRGAEPGELKVTEREITEAIDQLGDDVRVGLELAIENVSRVASAGVTDERVVSFESHEVRIREAPVERAAVYVPGGRAPYPSTVVMGVATARAAGVPRVAVCTPPSPDGTINPVVLAACRLTGATDIYRMGGAQAVAALAFGTESVRAVDVIVGPGNLYVQEAKRQLSGHVGIDSFAGPSDLVVIADGDVDLELVALDLLAQAEHGPGTLVLAVSSSDRLLTQLDQRLRPEPDAGAVCRLIHVQSTEDAIELAEAFAPEHLELLVPQAEQLASRVTRAGCVFVGEASGTAFGDYIAGSNHVLPTNGAARFASALGPRHFRRSFTEVRISDGTELAKAAAPLARAEGFELHARSMEARIRENGADEQNR